jgi:oligosaccharide repeat unit polymerase
VTRSSDMMLVSLGMGALLVLLPAVTVTRRLPDVLEPIFPIILATALGSTARAILVVTSGSEVYQFLTNGYPQDLIVKNGIWLLVGLLSLALGYMATTGRIHAEKYSLLQRNDWPERRVMLGVGLCLVAAVVGTVIFIRTAGINLSDLDSISNKRALQLTTDTGDTTFGGLGPLRLLAGAAQPAFYTLLIFLLTRGKKLSLGMLALLMGTLFLAVLPPFLSSSRSEVVVTIINALIIMAGTRRLSGTQIVAAVVVSLAIISGMGVLRAVAQKRTDVGELSNPVVAVVGSGNFVDIARTSIIAAEVPRRLDYLRGSSYLTWVFAPIPRLLWPDKPNVSLGLVVRQDIYGMRTHSNGFPPGLVAEAYMNFGALGVPIIGFVFGAVLRLIFNTLGPLTATSRAALLLYVGLYWRATFGAIGLNFSLAVCQVLQDLVPLVVLLYFISRKPRMVQQRRRLVPLAHSQLAPAGA